MPTPKPDVELLAIAQDFLSGNGEIPTFASKDFLFELPEVAKLYDLRRDKPVADSFMNIAALMADVAFRTPPAFIASTMKKHQESVGAAVPPMLLYEIQADNPYPGFPIGYRHANHGINDVLLFNPAEDQVAPELLGNWRNAVNQLQGAWLDFCYGKMPWAPFQASDKDGFDPIYVFPDRGEGRLCQELHEVDGTKTANRWRALLKAALEKN